MINRRGFLRTLLAAAALPALTGRAVPALAKPQGIDSIPIWLREFLGEWVADETNLDLASVSLMLKRFYPALAAEKLAAQPHPFLAPR
jgi:hypothetical protein